MTIILAPTLDAEQTSGILGISKWALYELIKRNECPVPVLHVGRSIRIPTRPLADLLGLDVEIVVNPPRDAAGAATPAAEPPTPEPNSIETEQDHSS